MADLVERLRKLSDDCMEDGYEDQGIGLHDAANELDLLRAEVASLKEERDVFEAQRDAWKARSERRVDDIRELVARHEKQVADLTQQLAAANGRVERMRGFGDSQPEFEAYAYQQGHLDFEQNEFGGYKNPHTSILWWFWKSSRDELRIKLSSFLSDLPYEVPSFDERSSEADKEKS